MGLSFFMNIFSHTLDSWGWILFTMLGGFLVSKTTKSQGFAAGQQQSVVIGHQSGHNTVSLLLKCYYIVDSAGSKCHKNFTLLFTSTERKV